MLQVMIQDNVPICPKCGGGLRKIHTDTDIVFICNDKGCLTSLKVIDFGQSQRELLCEVENMNPNGNTKN